MVAGRFKARTFRRVYRRTPSGKAVLRYRRRKPSRVTCGSCGTPLPAVPCLRTFRLVNLPKTAKRPERPYGGVLCSACLRRAMIARARA